MEINICLEDGGCESFEKFETAIDFLKNEKIKSEEIKVGDIVTIENYGKMYTTLDVSYFDDLWSDTTIEIEEIYNLMIHYDFGRSYCIGYNKTKEKDRVKWKVIFIHGQRVFIERQGYYPNIVRGQVLCIGKDGLKKCEI